MKIKTTGVKIGFDQQTFQPVLQVLIEVPLDAVIDDKTGAEKDVDVVALQLGRELIKAMSTDKFKNYSPPCRLTKQECDEEEGILDNYCPVHGRDIR